MRRRSCLGVLAGLGGLLLSAPASAIVVETSGLAVINLSPSPTIFTAVFGTPISVAGPTQVSVSILGAFGDGARDGASVAPFPGGSLVEVDFGGGVVAGAGGAASFAGAGGNAGTVLLSPVTAQTAVDGPVNFGFDFNRPIVPVAEPVAAHGGVAGGVVDGATDGALLTGQLPGGEMARFQVNNGATPVDSFDLGVGPIAEHVPFLFTGTDTMACSTSDRCDDMTNMLSFALSGPDDLAALLARQELGGDPIAGTVLQTYGLATGSGLFDCGDGCSLLTTTLSFQLSGGDAAVFAIRVVLDTPATVPEPATVSVLGAALFGLVAVARRRRRV